MGTGAIFISGCYIVKDEEDVIAASLKALKPFVDEIVVYDTGSNDRTREIARECGAAVVEGYWDEDFGAARNRALAHCRGTWVVSVDADEVATGDARAFRRTLWRTSDADVMTVVQSSDAWGGAGHLMRLRVPRVLRRSHCHWTGALHEHIVGRRGQNLRAAESQLVLEHSGYTDVRAAERDKGNRNLRVAEKELETALARGEDPSYFYVNVGRSASLVGANDRALRAFERLDRATVHPNLGILAAHSAIGCALAVGDLDTAAGWVVSARSWGEDVQVCRSFEARLAMARRDFAEAEQIFRSLQDSMDRRGIRFEAASCSDDLIRCLLAQDRHQDAFELLLEVLSTGRTNFSAVFVLQVAGREEGDAARLVAALPENLEKPFIGQLQGAPATFSHPFFDALWSAGRSRIALLLSVAEQWPSLPFDMALTWSLRMREAGMADRCPLRRIVNSDDLDLQARIVSAVALLEVGEDEHLPLLEELLARVPESNTESVVAAVREVSPSFAQMLVPV